PRSIAGLSISAGKSACRRPSWLSVLRPRTSIAWRNSPRPISAPAPIPFRSASPGFAPFSKPLPEPSARIIPVNAANDVNPIGHIETIWIPMSDGTKLAGRLWRPEDAERNPVPAIVEYIPYRRRDGTRDGEDQKH